MIYRFPSFYEDFSCIGGSCKKSCCIGWELDVDQDSYDYYMNLPGEFGDRIRRELRNLPMEDGEDSHCFCLPESGRCPFLNDENLCDIVLKLGDEALCDICGTYPRYSFSYGDYIEKSLTVSCEEVARLLFNETNGLRFIESKIPREYYETEESQDSPTPEEISDFISFRDDLFKKIQDRSLSFEDRLADLLKDKNYRELSSKEERLYILSLLESIDGEWTDSLVKLQENVDRDNIPFKENAYENLLVYFLFRYLPRGLFDGDYNSKIRFCLFCLFCIRDLEEIYEDTALAASAFSREVEHSEENIELIMEELLFN